MVRHSVIRWGLPGAILAAMTFLPVAARAAEPSKGLAPADPKCETVDLFSGIEKGQLAVQLIPRDPWQCRLLVTNKTDKPLNVALPEVLAGAPVLAQIGLPNARNAPNARNRNRNNPVNANNANNNATQALGLPMGPGNPMGPGLNQGNPMMNNRPGNLGPMFCVPPEKTGQLRIASVCLEHGKPNPRPSVPYELKPIDGLVAKPEVSEVLRMLGQGTLGQRATQAAVWHLNNNLTWQQLEAMKTDKFLLVGQPRFSAQDLADAKTAVDKAAKQVQQRGATAASRSTAAR